MKRGLVLEGGGAKGAYQLGCLIAFKERQIQFDVIAGTSVGALNGALASSHKLCEGADYWKNLSFGHVVAPRWWYIPIAPLLLLYIVSYYYNNRGLSSPFTARNIKLSLLFVAFMAVVVATQAGIITAIYYVLGMSLLGGVPWVAYFFLRAVHFSILRPSPLEVFLRETISSSKDLKIPLYVTLADHQLGFDPDLPRLLYGKYDDRPVWGAVEDEYEYPNYFLINDLSLAQQQILLLGSAALPLGIFPPIRMGSREYVDGGVADNFPLYPLVTLEQCDELVVIALRPTQADSLKKHWQEVDRRLRLRNMTVEYGKDLYYAELTRRKGDYKHAVHYYPPVNLPLRQPESWPSRTIVISPKRRLGTFLTGTMNFRSYYARRMINQGYLDALAVIEKQFPALTVDSR